MKTSIFSAVAISRIICTTASIAVIGCFGVNHDDEPSPVATTPEKVAQPSVPIDIYDYAASITEKSVKPAKPKSVKQPEIAETVKRETLIRSKRCEALMDRLPRGLNMAFAAAPDAAQIKNPRLDALHQLATMTQADCADPGRRKIAVNLIKRHAFALQGIIAVVLPLTGMRSGPMHSILDAIKASLKHQGIDPEKKLLIFDSQDQANLFRRQIADAFLRSKVGLIVAAAPADGLQTFIEFSQLLAIPFINISGSRPP